MSPKLFDDSEQSDSDSNISHVGESLFEQINGAAQSLDPYR